MECFAVFPLMDATPPTDPFPIRSPARADTQTLHWERKQEQDAAARTISELETKWGELISKNFQTEHACMLLEAEIASLEARAKRYMISAFVGVFDNVIGSFFLLPRKTL